MVRGSATGSARRTEATGGRRGRVPTPWIFQYGAVLATSIVYSFPTVGKLRDSYPKSETEKRTGGGVFGRWGWGREGVDFSGN